MTLRIRNAEPADSDLIARFNAQMAEETENRRLDPAVIGPGVRRLLEDPRKGRYWVAVENDEIVGQIMVTYEWSDWRNGVFWWIQSVYVKPARRRQGVFSALYRHVEALAEADPDACGLRLYHEGENERARQTYEALGMTTPGYRIMEAVFASHGGER